MNQGRWRLDACSPHSSFDEDDDDGGRTVCVPGSSAHSGRQKPPAASQGAAYFLYRMHILNGGCSYGTVRYGAAGVRCGAVRCSSRLVVSILVGYLDVRFEFDSVPMQHDSKHTRTHARTTDAPAAETFRRAIDAMCICGPSLTSWTIHGSGRVPTTVGVGGSLYVALLEGSVRGPGMADGAL